MPDVLSIPAAGAVLAAALLLLLFIGLLFLGSILLPGARVDGGQVDGSQGAYKLNGLALFLLSMVVAALGEVSGGFSLAVLHTHFAALFVAANLFAFAVSGWLYRRGAGAPDRPAGRLRGFFFGREQNPTCCGVDLKLFSYRPSLIGLALFNLSFAVVQYQTYGALTPAMALYQVFTFLYVLNYFQFEHGMVHTWDIVSERFGWMLVWGDYVLVPFFYCLAGWWLVDAPAALLSPGAGGGIVLLFLFGFWLFRGANEQKHRFKQDANTSIWGKPAQTLDGRLLVSGFWGIGRHLNYTGEICVYLAFILTTGCVSWLPFLLPLWLVALLSHRAWRDEQRCRAKYGDLWGRYKRHARFSMVPFVY